MTESLLLSISGTVLGALFARWASRLLVSLLSTSGVQVVLDLSIDGRVLAFTAAAAVATALLFGLAPAWRSTRVQPHAAMKTNARGVVEGRSRWNLGKALVTVQIALSFVLLVGAGLRNAHYPAAQRAAVYREILDRMRATPGVRRASSSGETPISNGLWNSYISVDDIRLSRARIRW